MRIESTRFWTWRRELPKGLHVLRKTDLDVDIEKSEVASHGVVRAEHLCVLYARCSSLSTHVI